MPHLPARLPPALLLIGFALAGCADQRRQLGQALSGKPPVIAGSLEGDWVLADLNGGGAPAQAVTLRFDGGDAGTSRVAGSAGCNRFSGRWQQAGQAITLGPLATTEMACPPAVMAVEQRVLAALAAVTGVTFNEKGEATLASRDGRRLLLRRPAPPAG